MVVDGPAYGMRLLLCVVGRHSHMQVTTNGTHLHNWQHRRWLHCRPHLYKHVDACLRVAPQDPPEWVHITWKLQRDGFV